MIHDFEAWSEKLGGTADLVELSGCRVAIEAADYINTRILTYPGAREPLVPALGGVPLIMKHQVESDMQKFKSYNITPFFVFSGLEFATKDDPFLTKREQSKVNADAWELYNRHEADRAVNRFGESSYITAEELFRPLQAYLTENDVCFMVAPYSAWAQLAHFEKNSLGPKIVAHAVAGSSELFLFQCNRVITSWDFANAKFNYVYRETLMADMKKVVNIDITDDMFVDACMLAGNNILPTHPNVAQRKNVLKPLAAIEMMKSNGRTGIQLCINFHNDPRFESQDYLDKYRKARMAVKHHPIFTTDGKVQQLDHENLPNDSHQFIGYRLPDELFTYMSQGLIGTRVVNWRASAEIIEDQPLDGGDSEEYRKLVSSKLTSLRVSAVAVLSSTLHRFYQHKDLTMKCWYSNSPQSKHYTSTITMKDLPDYKSKFVTWNVKERDYADAFKKVQGHGVLGSTVLSLRDDKFASKTITKIVKDQPQLRSANEVLYNGIWRFLALREYVDSDHKLTPWGEVLAATIAALKGNAELEEPAIVAVELLRLKLLNSDNMFTYSGAPMRGSDIDRRNNLLVSRVACLGTLHHKAIGFTGPLSQHLLAYHSMITAVRNTLRDVAEATVAHALLNHDVVREFDQYKTVGMKLPFLIQNDCALGIAVKSYLDELIVHEDPTSAETKKSVVETASSRYFPQCVDLPRDLETAFGLWDAVYAGVKSSGSLVKDQKLWDEVNEWLSGRR